VYSRSAILTGKILLAALALTAGGAIYIFLRSTDPLFFKWAEIFGMDGFFSRLRSAGGLSETNLPIWFRYALPDGLWAFAYALLISAIWSGSTSRLRWFWMISIPVLILGFEFAQLTSLVSGTFCLLDLSFSTAGLVLGVFLGTSNPKASPKRIKSAPEIKGSTA